MIADHGGAMPSCCYGDEYGWLFSDRAARRTARRYAHRGLRGSAALLARSVAATGITGATVLEVGGGVGQIHADLLRRGGARAINVELSPNWEPAAMQMLGEMGLRQRVERRVADFVDAADGLPVADVVILHRVICCYPDWAAMVTATSSRARRTVGLTVPADHWGTRAAIRSGNWMFRLQRRCFRAYVHPPAAMITALEADGLRVVADHRGVVWRTIVARRDTPRQ